MKNKYLSSTVLQSEADFEKFKEKDLPSSPNDLHSPVSASISYNDFVLSLDDNTTSNLLLSRGFESQRQRQRNSHISIASNDSVFTSNRDSCILVVPSPVQISSKNFLQAQEIAKI
ncbi:hypothetical protein CONCODRAFT_2073 [Conidiobolus coronatus NRRL 28638]|uniref:Uncharacterized protein n=1 Tax=Conidiobolus coronatus (strain ATCC 28846 / CBS 209.66 / NRRL 28638) TaxID=796925 RepID=A0A137PIE5_CONC2|nr:hypothetical protein CONCODRAFT_2073 [Conidiobolus coronatus NRRL 28638]|eukprot:KXN74759.1 hypothetical protein CONCODRAFT_2073 [Conidiobolus coronatus NRRL 28638]